ncbi:MAG TPA: hypothetical protein V6C81_14610 [Planktothrix sp.]|jgi:hypothetical protein
MGQDSHTEIAQPKGAPVDATAGFEGARNNAFTPAGQTDYRAAMAKGKCTADLSNLPLSISNDGTNDVWNQYQQLTESTKQYDPAHDQTPTNPPDGNGVWSQYKGLTESTKPYQYKDQTAPNNSADSTDDGTQSNDSGTRKPSNSNDDGKQSKDSGAGKPADGNDVWNQYENQTLPTKPYEDSGDGDRLGDEPFFRPSQIPNADVDVFPKTTTT